MANERQYLIHLHNESGLTDTTRLIQKDFKLGEIAVNNALTAEDSAIYTTNKTFNELVKFIPEPAIDTKIKKVSDEVAENSTVVSASLNDINTRLKAIEEGGTPGPGPGPEPSGPVDAADVTLNTYQKQTTYAPISTLDNVEVALGKLEAGLEGSGAPAIKSISASKVTMDTYSKLAGYSPITKEDTADFAIEKLEAGFLSVKDSTRFIGTFSGQEALPLDRIVTDKFPDGKILADGDMIVSNAGVTAGKCYIFSSGVWVEFGGSVDIIDCGSF